MPVQGSGGLEGARIAISPNDVRTRDPKLSRNPRLHHRAHLLPLCAAFDELRLFGSEPKHPLEALRHSSGSSWDCIMPVFECPRPSSNWPISWMMTSLSGKYGLLRHRLKISIGTFASRLVMAGIILFAAKELLGHHSSQRYAHLAPSHVKRAVEALACRKQLTPSRKSA